MKIKTSELKGAALDWAVAKCEGMDFLYCKEDGFCFMGEDKKLYPYQKQFNPSTNWSQGGPIIEREGITINTAVNNGRWVAYIDTAQCSTSFFTAGEAPPLVIAMRCYCASKLGPEVDIPEELV